MSTTSESTDNNEEKKLQTQQKQQQKQEAPVAQQAASNPFESLFSTEKLIQMGILITRIGFVMIFVLTLLLQGKAFYHFVVLFFLTFGLNCSLLYYRQLMQQNKQKNQQLQSNEAPKQKETKKLE